jgi:hypothetical protein
MSLGSSALVAMMEPADLWNRNDLPAFCRLNAARLRRVLLQSQMRPAPMIQPVNLIPIILNRARFITAGIPGTDEGSGYTESARGERSRRPGVAWNRHSVQHLWKFRFGCWK